MLTHLPFVRIYANVLAESDTTRAAHQMFATILAISDNPAAKADVSKTPCKGFRKQQLIWPTDTCEADSYCANSPSGCCYRGDSLESCNATRRIKVYPTGTSSAMHIAMAPPKLGVVAFGIALAGLGALLL